MMSTDPSNASRGPLPPLPRLTALAVGAALWLAVPTVGFAMLLSHQYAAGEHGSKVISLEKLDAIGIADEGQPRLIVTLHPHCPCSKTTLDELRLLLAETKSPIRATALFVLPAGITAEGSEAAIAWTEESASWQLAATIPGLERSLIGEAEARTIGPRTSGHVLLFDADGAPLFDGGITLGRGHAGDNDGRRALAAALRNERPRVATHPVYGCGLFDDRATAQQTLPASAPSCCASAAPDRLDGTTREPE
jgi:hypothetical protein